MIRFARVFSYRVPLYTRCTSGRRECLAGEMNPLEASSVHMPDQMKSGAEPSCAAERRQR